MVFSSREHNYPDDIFDNTRMSFGEHIEELRTRLLRALAALGICLLIGFVLDGIGESLGMDSFGVGRPMMQVIVSPVESQVRAFYARRNEQVAGKVQELTLRRTPPERVDELYKRLQEDGLDTFSHDEIAELQAAPVKMPVYLELAPLAQALGVQPPENAPKEIELPMQIYPAYVNYFSNRGEAILQNRQYLTTLSVQEAFVVYFKVSLLCGVVLSSPWIFYQIWAFVAAGLYPHERRYVHMYLPFSVGLFVGGAVLCQFVVLPGAVKALLAFNRWIELDPDLRLNEWLGFALVLPVVFGVSFQTPLVMLFLNRIGTFSADDYLRYWRYAIFVLALFAAVITPTPDVVTMSYLFVPMFGLYMLGIAICYFFPATHDHLWDDEKEQVAV
ncbi:MAG: twin-arginine translocase subunit TatC [Bacteroidales bacterium]|nr:twin-arginine translocase subunit TatC [Bacteroidales bacterium]